MVIILTFLGAILFFLSVMFVQQRTWRIILATITGLIFVGSTALMTLNYSHHFGMHKVTTTTTRRIYPVHKCHWRSTSRLGLVVRMTSTSTKPAHIRLSPNTPRQTSTPTAK